MTNIVFMGNTIELRADGQLMDIHDWTPELAEKIAQNEGLVLTSEHWDVIYTMREYYHSFNTSPILKLLRRELGKKYGPERG